MPLFTFKCLECSKTVEKFLKSPDSSVKCECGSCNLERQFVVASGNVWKGAEDYLENVVNPEVDRIQRELGSGRDSTFIDIAGDV
jgi:putative FmdB family regulatory protein